MRTLADIFAQIFRTLWAHKLRSFLTMFGIAWGIGSLLLLPVLRTRGHYAALVTIAFALLLKTFLEVNDVLGGPQGLQVKGMKIFGWSFNDNIEIGKISLSFYLSYFVVSMLLLVGAFVLVRRLERSWIGLNLDALRLDDLYFKVIGGQEREGAVIVSQNRCPPSVADFATSAAIGIRTIRLR